MPCVTTTPSISSRCEQLIDAFRELGPQRGAHVLAVDARDLFSVDLRDGAERGHGVEQLVDADHARLVARGLRRVARRPAIVPPVASTAIRGREEVFMPAIVNQPASGLRGESDRLAKLGRDLRLVELRREHFDQPVRVRPQERAFRRPTRVVLASNKCCVSSATSSVSRFASYAIAATMPIPMPSSTYVLITSASIAVSTISGIAPAFANAWSTCERPVKSLS